MARIRTIKPEFPQSETVGNLSRDARLLFIQLWTICDDSGRTRAASRMLASLLYPYDDDAREQIPGWLEELDRAGCIRLYQVDGQHYLDIPKWLDHQKIDRPSASKFPAFDEASRVFDEPSRKIAQDQGRDQGPGPVPGEEGNGAVAPAPPVDEAVEVYNLTADQAGWSRVQRLTDPRKRSLVRRLTECGGLEGWQCAMAKAAASKFLTGKLPRGPTHANWRPDFDWFVNASNFTKLMEGSYDNRNDGFSAPGASHVADFAQAADLLRGKQYHGL